MTSNSHTRRPTLGILAVASGLMLASCQTSADEMLSLGEASPAEEASGDSAAKKAFRDPYVSAISGQVADGSASTPSQNVTDPARLKRKPVPMAAAYSDIAEPPPEVLALQQQAMQGDTPQTASRPPADLGDLTMQPTNASPRSNSLFSAGQRQQPAAIPTVEQAAAAETAAGQAAPRASLVPNEMPTLGVNAVSKSLFSPSAEQQMLMQQRALEEQARAEAAAQAPLVTTAAVGGEEPVLTKLSDPRPKRKMLALREPVGSVPERVQLTPDQLQAMGAVEEADPAEPLSAEELMADAEAAKKKGWLPSFSDLLKGGKKATPTTSAP